MSTEQHSPHAEPAAVAATGPHQPPVIPPWRFEGRIVAHWPLRRIDANGYQPRAELTVSKDLLGYTAKLTALHMKSAHHRFEATGAPRIEYTISVDEAPSAEALERAYETALSTLRARFDDGDTDVYAFFDHRSRIYTDPRMFVPFETPDIPAHDYPVRRWEMHRDTDVTGNSGTGLVAHGVTFPDGRVAFRWRGNPATTTTADSIRDVISIHGHNGTTRVVYVDTEPAWHDSTRVAVRVGAHDEVETWAVLRCPIIDLGSYDAEATSIGSRRRHRRRQRRRISRRVLHLGTVQLQARPRVPRRRRTRPSRARALELRTRTVRHRPVGRRPVGPHARPRR
jgi:hypothetical protein